jgi:MSHA biogenesis protein MshJ
VNALLKSTLARYDVLSLRERALIAVSVIALIALVWDWTIHQGINRRLTTTQADITSLRTRLLSEAGLAEQLQNSLKEDPNRKLAAEEDALTEQIAELDERLDNLVGGFVAPSKMPVLLEDVVTRHEGVTLQRVANLPVEPVRQRGGGEIVPGLYKHAMRVELRGSYFAVRDYLTELEAAPWRFSWRSVSYQVEQYPQAAIILEIETMSREKNWLGV